MYAGDEEFLQGTVPFLQDGLRGGEAMLVAVGATRIALLRGALGADASAVRFFDMHELGCNPARIMSAWFQFLADSDGAPARGIGEPVWPGRGQDELAECDRHESLLNTAFDAGRPWQLLCPYDLEGLAPDVIDGARRNHPLVSERGELRRSAPDAASRAPDWPLSGTLPPPRKPPREVAFSRADLAGLRASVAGFAREAIGAERTQQLVLAVNELASNSVRYGGGEGLLRMWREDESLLCEVSDAGRIEDPLAGRRPPAPEQPAGRGLWLVNQLCDLVQLRSSRDGTTVRVQMRLA